MSEIQNTTPSLPTQAEVTPQLSEREKVFAATNDPALATDEFKLGDRTFKVMNLRYDDYIKFLAYLKPFLDGIGRTFMANQGVKVPDIEVKPTDLNMGALLTFCLNDLPEMARIVCAQTDPTVTADQVKEWAGEPFTLCAIVLKQVSRNNMIGQFASFFGQMLPILKRMGMMRTAPTASTTKETHSS